MLKKRILAVLLTAVMLISLFSGCAGEDGAATYGDVLSKDALRICVDSMRTDPTRGMSKKQAGKFFDELAEELKAECGIEKVVFELLPQYDVPKRQTALMRLRTEIMAGEGPDVFIVQTATDFMNEPNIENGAIFNYPEKSMEVGLFLPLDGYMENHTQYTDWDAQTQVVLNAGRSAEGQVLIPMTYDVPILLCPNELMNIPYTKDLTRVEILDDPKTAELGAILYTTLGKAYDFGVQPYFNALRDSLGKYGDYENETLLFTEEELYSIANEAGKLQNVMNESERPEPIWSTGDFGTLRYEIDHRSAVEPDAEYCLLPRYTKDGGVAARVTAFMAVNRSTKFPEEAFSVIDYLMQEKMQRENYLFSWLFARGFALQNDLGSGEKPFGEGNLEEFLHEPHMGQLLEIKEQITAVSIDSELDVNLDRMFKELFLASGTECIDTDLPREPVQKTYERMAQAMKE